LQSGHFDSVAALINKEAGVKTHSDPIRVAKSSLTLKDKLWALFRTSVAHSQISDQIENKLNSLADSKLKDATMEGEFSTLCSLDDFETLFSDLLSP